MSYTVVWLKAAQDQLADIWTSSLDRQAVANASDALDIQLRGDPYRLSESRDESRYVQIHFPLGVTFKVNDQDRMVTVSSVWLID